VGALSIGRYLGGYRREVGASRALASAANAITAMPVTASMQVESPAPVKTDEPPVKADEPSKALALKETPAHSARAARTSRAMPAFRTLSEKARRLLAEGRLAEGIEAAGKVIAEDPALADGYILLAAGLEDQGKWPAATKVLHTCTEKATKGPVGLCGHFEKVAENR
jgi:hypothetical protein